MKRSLISLVMAAALAVIPVAYARPGGFGGPFHQPPYGGGGWGRGGHSGFYFYGGFPLWWPYGYYGPPYDSGYYYDYPPAYYYDGAYRYPTQDARSWLVLGHDAGKDLRLQTVTWGWFVQYLRAYIINAPPGTQDDFRRGFMDGYGDSAESVLSSAMQQAQPPPVPPPPPRPGNAITSPPAGSSNSVPTQQK